MFYIIYGTHSGFYTETWKVNNFDELVTEVAWIEECNWTITDIYLVEEATMENFDAIIEELTQKIKGLYKEVEGIEAQMEELTDKKDEIYEKISHYRSDISCIKRTKAIMEVK